MSTSTSNFPVHAGLERVSAGASVISKALATVFARKNTTKLIVAVGVITGITIAERVVDSANPGFVAELAIVSSAAVLAFGATVAIVLPALRLMRNAAHSLLEQSSQLVSDQAFLASAMADRRIMSELHAAQDRAGHARTPVPNTAQRDLRYFF
jgi:hypothetical protein